MPFKLTPLGWPFLAAVSAHHSFAGVGSLLGVRILDLENIADHDSLPEDGLLPRASTPDSTPDSAGTTLPAEAVTLTALGVRWVAPTRSAWFLNFDAGALNGSAGDRNQNWNDARPVSASAFIDSEFESGLFSAFGLYCDLGRVCFDGQAEWNSLNVSSGWDRFLTEQGSFSSTKSESFVGPELSEDIQLEAASMFGDSTRFEFNLTVQF